MSDLGTFLTTVGSAFAAIFVAELGDKTQLLALGFGARYRLRTVFFGALIGFAVAGGLAAVVGGALGSSLPRRPLAILGGLAFIGFAVWTLIDRDDDDAVGAADEQDVTEASASSGRWSNRTLARSGIATIAVAIAFGELGDKTQLATAVLAAQSNPVAVWVGATAGEVSAAMVGAVFGSRVAARLNPATMRYITAGLFAVFGIVLLLSAR